MDVEFDFVSRTVGWESVWNITEQGSKLLTLEFLCTLQITDTGAKFRLFGKEFSSPWKDLSLLLAFNSQCVVDVDHAPQDFDKLKFWREIFRKTKMYHPHTNDIHHPTLRFMHKWLGFTLFPRLDFCTVRIYDLKLLYALVKRRKVSPIKFMMHQWKEVFTITGDVECTFLVTRMAQNLGLLDNAYTSYVAWDQWGSSCGYQPKHAGWE